MLTNKKLHFSKFSDAKRLGISGFALKPVWFSLEFDNQTVLVNHLDLDRFSSSQPKMAYPCMETAC
ncbi:hypothetical protein YC2023_006707 [Brassica napus]